MTTPTPAGTPASEPKPWDIPDEQAQAALDRLQSLAAGNQHINVHPGIMQALASSNATPQDAQVINQWMAGVKAQNTLSLARATGVPYNFNADERLALDAMGVNYAPSDAMSIANQQATMSTLRQQGLQPVLNQDGSLALDQNGNIQTTAAKQTAAPAKHNGFFDHGIGHAIGRVGHDILHNPATNLMAEGGNEVLTTGGDLLHTAEKFIQGATGGGVGLGGANAGMPNASAPTSISQAAQQLDSEHEAEKQMMAQMGYDPNSFWSQLAFDAHGYGRTDIRPAVQGWDNMGGAEKWGFSGADAMKLYEQQLKDPKGFIKNFVYDPSLGADEQAHRQAMIDSPEYQNFTKSLDGQSQTFGAEYMRNLGVNAEDDPRLFHMGAAATDLVASFYVDPTLLAGKVVNQVVRMPVAINGMSDINGALRALGTSGRIQRGWQSAIDDANAMRVAAEAGDEKQLAEAYAHFQASTPELEPFLSEFLGKSAVDLRATAERTGIASLADHFAVGERAPITNLDEAAQRIKDIGGLNRMANGAALAETSYMPGSLSSFGFRQVKGAIAAHLAGTDVERMAKASDDYLTAAAEGRLSEADKAYREAQIAKADPARPTTVIDTKKIEKYLASPIDGIDMSTGTVVAATDQVEIGGRVSLLRDAATTLNRYEATAARVAKANEATYGQPFVSEETYQRLERLRQNLEDAKSYLAEAVKESQDKLAEVDDKDWSTVLSFGEKGRIAYNLRRYGQATAPVEDGLHPLMWASPTAVWARTRLTATRLSTLLPHNTEMALEGSETVKKVYKYARTYLGKGASSQMAAMFANGSPETRKAIIEGLWDQVAQSAGLGKTKIGQEMLDSVRTLDQRYSNIGREWVVAGAPVAKADGETTKTLFLPSFKQIQRASAKIGLYEGTMGRMATSSVADFLFNAMRFGILFLPKTAYRNIIEPYLKAALDGQLGDLAMGHALTYASSEELAKIGEATGFDGLGEVPQKVKQIAAQRVKDAELSGTARDIKIAKYVQQRVEKGDLSAMAGFQRTRLGSKFSDATAQLLSYYRYHLIKELPPEVLAHVDELPDVIPQMAHLFGSQTIRDTFSGYADTAIRDIADSGLAPKELKINLAQGEHPLLEAKGAEGKYTRYNRKGYALKDTDNYQGLVRYYGALSRKTFGMEDVTKEAARMISEGDNDVTPLVKLFDSRTNLTGYGHLFKPNPDEQTALRAVTEDQIKLGKEQWARDFLEELRHLTTGQTGGHSEELMAHLMEHGNAPDLHWMQANLLDSEHLPKMVMAPEYTAQVLGGVHQIASALQDVTGKAFNQIVESPIKRQSSMPFLSAHYLNVRAEQDLNNAMQPLLDAGISKESANTLLKGEAIREAYKRVEQMIDDPGLKTQFDIVARNLFMFPRAMQAFIRRWGGSLYRDPFKARKMMIAMETAEHSGLIYRDQNGELTFTYPGSQVMHEAMAAISLIPGCEGFARFPIGSDMTGKVQLLAPGIDNPLRFSLSPMVNIPMRAVFALMPDHEVIWKEIDTALNGDIGASQVINKGPLGAALKSVEPGFVNRILQAMSGDDKNSLLASATASALANLYAAGYAPSPSDPPAVQDAFRNRVRTQVRNEIYWRLAFSFFAPAPPSNIEGSVNKNDAKDGYTGTGADPSFQRLGIKNLHDEYKKILDYVNGDSARARSIWYELHPNALAYTVATTGSGINKAYMPASIASANWMQDHLDFLGKYKSVGAYFMPKESGEFDRNAYAAQLQLGLRQKKSLSEYADDVQLAQSEQQYYSTVDQYNSMKAEALASGNNAMVSNLKSAYSVWKAGFLNQNLQLKAKLATNDVAKPEAQKQIEDLNLMIQNHDVPDGLTNGLSGMLSLWKDYQDWKSQQSQVTNPVDTATKQEIGQAVADGMLKIAESDDRLKNIYNAVFRTIDPQLLDKLE